MFEFLSWRELVVINDEVQYAKVVGELKEQRIPFRIKTQNIGNADRQSGRIGGIGENQRYTCLHQIYVKRVDFEKAKYIFHSIR